MRPPPARRGCRAAAPPATLATNRHPPARPPLRCRRRWRPDRRCGPLVPEPTPAALHPQAVEGAGEGRGSDSAAATAAARPSIERIAAAAGLLSSCASPAASRPSPASSSRSRRVASRPRTRPTTVRITASAISGPAASRSRMASTGMVSASAVDAARTVATRRPPSSAAISPWSEPGPTRATGISLVPERRVTSSSPESTTYSASASSPS